MVIGRVFVWYIFGVFDYFFVLDFMILLSLELFILVLEIWVNDE